MKLMYARQSVEFVTKHAFPRNGRREWVCKKTLQRVEFIPVEQRVEGKVPHQTTLQPVLYARCNNPTCIVWPPVPAPGTLIEESDLVSMGL